MGRIVNVSSWTWNFWGDGTGNTSKQQKIAAFNEKFQGENDFEAVLATLCCYDYGVNASEAIKNIVTDQKIITDTPFVL